MYKLFINNKTVWVVANPAQVKNILNVDNEYVIHAYRNKKELDILLENVLYNLHNNSDCVIFGKEPDRIFEELLSLFDCLEAGGGVVENKQGEILLIFRRGSWDLPKGKVDEGETIEQTALREVEEETGLKELEILKPVYFKGWKNTATYHSYELKGKHAMKISHWFEMKTGFEGDLVPQTEEDIEQVTWVPKKMVKDYFENMYPSIVDVLSNIV